MALWRIYKKSDNLEIANYKKQLAKSSNNLLKKELEEKISKQKGLLAKLNKERRDNVKNITGAINTFVKDWQLETPKEI
jgi:gas vesicle protein